MQDCWIRQGDILFVCFAINNYSSFEDAQSLLERICQVRDEFGEHNDSQEFAVILVATKCDLINDRKVTTNDALEMAKKWNIPYFETSSKANVNVHFMFKQSV